MNQKRQPKGTNTGGQFAPDVNPECTLELTPEPVIAADASKSSMYHCDNCDEVSFEEIHDCGATCREIDPDDVEGMELDEDRSSPNPDGEGDYVDDGLEGWGAAPGAEPDDDGFAADLDLINNPRPIIEQSERWIADTRENIQRILDAKAARGAGGGDTLDQLIEEGEIIDILKERIIRYQQDVVDEQRRELNEFRKNAGGFDLDRAIFDNVCATIECNREETIRDSSSEDVDALELSRLTDSEIEQVRALVDAHLENGISRGGDKALGYLIEEEAEYCLTEITSKLGDILKETS